MSKGRLGVFQFHAVVVIKHSDKDNLGRGRVCSSFQSQVIESTIAEKSRWGLAHPQSRKEK